MEEDAFREGLGAAAAVEELTLPRAVRLARLLEDRDDVGAHPSGVRVAADTEWVLMEVDVDVGSVTDADIRRREPVAVGFDRQDAEWPRTVALRPDFPRDLIHLNLAPPEEPANLCLSEEPWAEVRRRWTPAVHVALVRRWLADAATGSLHRDEQVVEPFLPGAAAQAVLPADCFEPPNIGRNLFGRFVAGSEQIGRPVYVFEFGHPTGGGQGFTATVMATRPRVHGVIHQSPRTLADLLALFGADDPDFAGNFDAMLRAWLDNAGHLGSQLLIVVVAPMTRVEGGPVERHDSWGFLVGASLREVGIAFDLWAAGGGGEGPKLFGRLPGPFGADVPIEQVNILSDLSAEAAAIYNGRKPSGRNILAIGAGALGSQVLANLARSGEAPAAVVDKDSLLPHNLARHAAWDRQMIGWSKVKVASFMDERLRARTEPMIPIVGDASRPGEGEDDPIGKAIRAADMILDLAASVAVSRRLARDDQDGGRRLALFLSPSGDDLVLLREDRAREVRLDHLEMNYYAAVVASERLEGHFTLPGIIRYARSCRERSSQMPQTSVALHAAIGAEQALRAIDDEAAAATVWRIDRETMAVERVLIDARPMRTFEMGDWTVLVTEGLIENLLAVREAALPAETGGVLLGEFDIDRRLVYVGHHLPAPPDSIEDATGFVRGAEGLKEAVDDVEAETHGMLRYVGEWHSHPDGVRARPSGEDVLLYAHLAEAMDIEDRPPIMLIIGEEEIGVVVGHTS